MAFYDENGKITIDEIAANSDIARLQSSAETIRKTVKKFEQLRAEASESKGMVAAAISEKASEMIIKLTKALSQIETSIALIRRTVAVYQQKDKAIRDTINSSW